MKQFLYTLALAWVALLMPQSSMAQTTFEYTYDAAGNRTVRNILSLKAATIDTTNTDMPPEKVDVTKKNMGTDILGDITLNLYPNPTVGKIEVTIENLATESKCEILVFDLKGGLLFNKKGISATSQIDLSSQPQGSYIIKILVDGNVSEWKIIKE